MRGRGEGAVGALKNRQHADRARRSRSTLELCMWSRGFYSRLQIEALRAVAKATQAR